MWWTIIIKTAGELLIKFGLKKKEESDASKARALEKTVESVNESIGVEEDIRDQQKEVDKSPSESEDDEGGLNFDSFNQGS